MRSIFKKVLFFLKIAYYIYSWKICLRTGGCNLKEVWVNQLVPGQDVDESFVIRKLDAREYNGRKYLSLEFGDKTGRIGGVCWEGAEDYRTLTAGSIVKVEGKVGTYNEMSQITVMAMEKIAEANFDPVDFLPKGPRDP